MSNMTKDEISNEIGTLSQLINLAVNLKNCKLKNDILNYAGKYRQELRIVYEDK